GQRGDHVAAVAVHVRGLAVAEGAAVNAAEVCSRELKHGLARFKPGAIPRTGHGRDPSCSVREARAVRPLEWPRPGETDMTHVGHPGNYAFCVAENPDDADNPWTRFSEDWGRAGTRPRSPRRAIAGSRAARGVRPP